MAAEIKTCIDQWLPGTLADEARRQALLENPINGLTPRGAAITSNLWKPGRTLRVRFLDGDPTVQTRLQPFAHIWSQYANLHFVFGNDPAAEIRISFRQPGSWSYIGTDALTIANNQPTMNYGWLTTTTEDDEYSRVVTHEFGHAIGFIHEHQNPVAEIPWDKPKVYQYYEGPPNNWTKDQVDTNLFQRYSATQTQYTTFDTQSIMLYPIPKDFTTGGFEVGWNRVLSDTDKQFVAKLYPFAAQPPNQLVPDAPAIAATIGQFGEINSYTFTVQNAGQYRMETQGVTDLVMGLFGPNSDAALVAQDDDSGGRLQPRIVTTLQPGAYTLHIRHFSAQRTGEYKVGIYTVK